MDESKARKLVDLLREQGVDAHVAHEAVYQIGIRVVLGDGREAVWDTDGTAGLEAQVMRDGMLVGFVPQIAGSAELTSARPRRPSRAPTTPHPSPPADPTPPNPPRRCRARAACSDASSAGSASSDPMLGAHRGASSRAGRWRPSYTGARSADCARSNFARRVRPRVTG